MKPQLGSFEVFPAALEPVLPRQKRLGQSDPGQIFRVRHHTRGHEVGQRPVVAVRVGREQSGRHDPQAVPQGDVHLLLPANGRLQSHRNRHARGIKGPQPHRVLVLLHVH